MEKGFVKGLKAKYAGLSIAKKSGGFNTDIILFHKWAYRVEKGWYGFALADAPNSWAAIINDFLVELETTMPDFKIHQIKLKFGGLRFYICFYDKCEDASKVDSVQAGIISEEILELQDWLYSESLVY